jgi:hypothetical protein
MKPLPLALLIIGAMLIGAGVTYWTVRQLPHLPVPQAQVAPPLIAPPSKTRAPEPKAEEPRMPQASALDEKALESAVAAAKAARARGELKPIATTPEEFARELGRFNYRLIEFITAFPEQPADGTPEAATYRERIDQLTAHYANLTVDEELLADAKEETPEQLARVQAHLAGGSLELDAAGVAKLEALLRGVYQKLFPLDESLPDAEAKLDAATEEITTALAGFLTPEQRARLELMGTDQVLFGLPQPEP